ncbi:hypothetical protein NDN11_10680 [Acinetobacter sp. C26M]|uniref:hypothetical protein n=1 Tax=unclassified Acinetobacter TaxID=196816 RepID=UPI0020367978|nr:MULTISPECIES: hypothetical protein [unclassified Acinetobacter]USA45195.1 hypothetical protein NDN11_10680 [Acinetobacter sp. C26M]USA48697.1 hypothetical protein NDN12_10680 [Acinetobacter sp. C26G]
MSTITTVESIAELKQIQSPVNGRTVHVKSYILSKNVGGGLFTYDGSKSNINDGGVVINGWCRVSIEQSLRPEWFGCIANGVDSDNNGLDLLTAYAKENNRAIYLGDSKLKLTRQWLIDFPIVMSGDGGFGYSAANYTGDRHGGCVINSSVVNDYAIKISPTAYRFGLNISNFTLLGDATGFGLRIHNIGWNASVSNITCDNFKGRNLSLGYNQDIHFYNITCVRSKNTPDNPSLHFDADANYVYFHGCRFENANYLINTDVAWQVHFDHCHFEVGYYNNALGLENEYRYTDVECIRSKGKWVNFNNCTFVPIPSQVLMNLTGKSIANIPFFMDFSCTVSNLKLCDMINPSDDVSKGGIKFLKSVGSRSRNKIIGGNYTELDSRTPTIVADHLDISTECLLHFRKQDTLDFFGLAINVGSLVGCTIAKDADTVKKTNGYLQFTYIPSGFKAAGNTYDLDDRIFKFFNEACIVSENQTDWHDFSGSVNINMAEVHPQRGLRSNIAASTILNLLEVPFGREIPVFFNAGSGTVKFVPNYLITRTANDLNAQAFSTHLFKKIGATVNQIS